MYSKWFIYTSHFNYSESVITLLFSCHTDSSPPSPSLATPIVLVGRPVLPPGDSRASRSGPKSTPSPGANSSAPFSRAADRFVATSIVWRSHVRAFRSRGHFTHDSMPTTDVKMTTTAIELWNCAIECFLLSIGDIFQGLPPTPVLAIQFEISFPPLTHV